MFELNEHIIDLFDNYLEGKLKGEELSSFEKMLSENPELSKEFQLYQTACRVVEENASVDLKERIAKLQHQHHLTGGKLSPLIRTSLFISAGIAILGLLTWIFFADQSLKTENQKDKGNNSSKKEIVFSDKGDGLKTSEEAVDTKGSVFNNNVSDDNRKAEKISKADNKNYVIDKTEKTDNQVVDKNDVKTYRSAEIPVVSFGSMVTKGCVPLTVRFVDSSKVKDGQIVRYLWDFGDGSTSNLQNPVHEYTRYGVFTVKLTVWSNEDVKNELAKNNYITVNLTPKAEFKADPEITSLKDSRISFTNLTRFTTSKTKYSWKFGDNFGHSNVKNPVYSFSDTGIYEIILTAVNEFGCTSTASKKVIVLGGTDVFIPTAFSPDGRGPSENNVFRVVATGFESFLIQIVSRSGELLYESSDYATHGWNGSRFASNDLMPAGVYIVKVTVTGLDGKKYNFSKGITLIR